MALLNDKYFKVCGPFLYKSSVCEPILRSLPNWFGIEAAIVHYVAEIDKAPTILAYVRDQVVGFLSVKLHNPYSAEIYVMAIKQEYHRQGIGKTLVEYAQQWLKDQNIEYLQVKTVGPSSKDENYAKTRDFYSALGFRPLEEIDEIWDKHNPCLIMIKRLQ